MLPSLAKVPWLNAETSRRLMDVLTAGSVPARFVGGCVRDALIGEVDPDVDLDVATPLLPDQVIARLEAADIKVIPTGLKHGTVTAIVDGRAFEITTLRKDIACDGRHAEVEFTDDFKQDAARRDFTINAMSTDRHGRLADYFGGVADLEAGKIRFVGDAQTRVREDYLRILRFFRFYARYGKPPPDPEALEACREGAEGLARISGERIRAEMLKLLAAGNAVAALTLMTESSVLCRLLPIDVDLTPLARLIDIAPASDALLRLAALLRSSPDPTSSLKATAAWHFSNAETARLERLIQASLLSLPLAESESRKTAYRLGKEPYRDLLHLSAQTRADLDDAFPLPITPPFPLKGQDLVDRGVPQGPDVGQRLKQLEDWWLDNDLQPDRDATLQELDRRLANP
jgi:poly(A) polymerase